MNVLGGKKKGTKRDFVPFYHIRHAISQEKGLSEECPERDLNSHALSGAAPSRRCVCQFHHPGIKTFTISKNT